MSIAEDTCLIVGVDTHLDSHTAALWAVEGTRHCGLAWPSSGQRGRAGHRDRQQPARRKRHAGKSDPIDAVRAVRELLARPHPAQIRADGDHEALRLLMTGRDNAVQSGKTARTALVTAPADLRERLPPLPVSGGPGNAPRSPARPAPAGRPGCCTRP